MEAHESSQATPPLPPKVDPESLALRAPPQSVVRLNRRMLVVLAAVIAGGVLGALLWSLKPHKRVSLPQASELYNVDRVSRAENLDQLPKDYSKLQPPGKPGVPQLGPPLPGDLGPAILHAQQRGQANGTPGYNDAAQAERLARVRDAEEAAKSAVFFRGSNGTGAAAGGARTQAASGAAVGGGSQDANAASASSETRSGDPTAVQNVRSRRRRFSAGKEMRERGRQEPCSRLSRRTK